MDQKIDQHADAWENAHRERVWGVWPSEHLVRFAMRTYGTADRRTVRFLDLGCGVGASSRFLGVEGFSVTAVDRSPSAVDRLEHWASGRIFGGYFDTVVGDVEKIDFAHEAFDCIVDVCSLQHMAEPLLVLGRATKWLKPGGRIFSVWASDGHDKEIAEAITGHCWRLDSTDIGAHFAVFKGVTRELSVFTDGGRCISHWLVTGKKSAGST